MAENTIELIINKIQYISINNAHLRIICDVMQYLRWRQSSVKREGKLGKL